MSVHSWFLLGEQQLCQEKCLYVALVPKSLILVADKEASDFESQVLELLKQKLWQLQRLTIAHRATAMRPVVQVYPVEVGGPACEMPVGHTIHLCECCLTPLL